MSQVASTGDTAVVTANKLHNAGGQVDAVILLDPAFESDTLGLPNNADFNIVVQGLVTSSGAGDPAVPVFIADAYGGEYTTPLDVSKTDTEFYEYQGYSPMDHYPVLNSPVVRQDIFAYFGW